MSNEQDQPEQPPKQFYSKATSSEQIFENLMRQHQAQEAAKAKAAEQDERDPQ